MNRINWIDWAKAIAITFVVFGHIPEKDSFLQGYITSFHMPLFFFISGYLTKKEYLNIVTFKKYWNGLIIPYICYNVLFLPYWLIRHAVEYPEWSIMDLSKPLVGMLLCHVNTSFSEPLNTVTWFLIALFFMKIIMAVCNNMQKSEAILSILAIMTAVLYLLNIKYQFNTTDITFINLIRDFSFFYLGHISKSKGIIPENCTQKDWFLCFCGLITSVTATYLRPSSEGIVTYAVFFWLICISAILGVIGFCRLINPIYSKIIYNVSLGTIVIMGLHWMLIGGINFILGKVFNISDITYPWYTAILIAIIIEAMLYPVILICKHKFPILLGKKKIEVPKSI